MLDSGGGGRQRQRWRRCGHDPEMTPPVGTRSSGGGDPGDTLSYTGEPGPTTINLDGSPGSTDTISGFVNATGSNGVDTIVGSAGQQRHQRWSGRRRHRHAQRRDGRHGQRGTARTRSTTTPPAATRSSGGGDPGDTLSYVGQPGPTTIHLDGSPGSTDTISGFVNATGSNGVDTIVGIDGDNVINGGPGGDDIDTRNGGPGDKVNGGRDADTIHDDSRRRRHAERWWRPGRHADATRVSLARRRSISMGRRAART